MIKAIIFDFDGVIIESSEIKTEAFRELFLDHPAHVDKIVDYHKANMGVSRFVKFRHIHANILKLPLTTAEEKELGNRFTAIVYDKVLNTAFVAGACEFLAGAQEDFLLFVASGTPEAELLDIAVKRGVLRFFREIHGSPREKKDIIRDILERYHLEPAETVFVGDAESDLKAAGETGVHFVARITEGYGELNRCAHQLKDLRSLRELLAGIDGAKSWQRK